MSRKFILMAIAAAATLGTALVSVDTASAAPGVRTNIGRVNVSRVHVNRVNFHRPHRPHFRPHFPRRPHWHVRWHHPRIWYAPRPVIYGAVAPVVTTTNRCTCLTKEYTPEGAVLFKDICTNEAAINPPAVAPTAQVQPQ